MLLSKLKPETRKNYIDKAVRVQSVLFKGDAVLQALHNKNYAVVRLAKQTKFSAKCKTELRTLVVSVDHVFI